MSTEEPAASPMPNHTRHGGSEPEGRADRTGEYVISIGDVLRDSDAEPPLWTIVELGDGERWRRLPSPNDRCWGSAHTNWEPVWRWGRVTWDGPVTVFRVPTPVVGGVRCRHCGFLVAEKSGGLACKSGEPCPFHGKTIEYLAPPGL